MIADRNVEGAAWAERALSAAGPLRRVETIAEAMNTKGVCLQNLGRLDEGIALIRASVDLAAAHHLSAAELRARFNLAGRLDYDDPNDAIEVLRAGIEVARRTGRRDWLIMLSHFLSTSLMAFGLDYRRSARGTRQRRRRGQAAGTTSGSDGRPREDPGVSGRPVGLASDLSRGTGDGPRDVEHPGRLGLRHLGAWVAIAEGRLADATRASMAIGGNWAAWGGLRSCSGRAPPRGPRRGARRPGSSGTQERSALSGTCSASASKRGSPPSTDDGMRRSAAIGRPCVAPVNSGPLGTAADLLLDAVYALPPGDPERRPSRTKRGRCTHRRAPRHSSIVSTRQWLASRQRPHRRPGPSSTAPR